MQCACISYILCVYGYFLLFLMPIMYVWFNVIGRATSYRYIVHAM